MSAEEGMTDHTPEPTAEDVARHQERFEGLVMDLVLPAAQVGVQVLEIADEGKRDWFVGLLVAAFSEGYSWGAIELAAQGLEQGADVRLDFYDEDGRIDAEPREDGAADPGADAGEDVQRDEDESE